MIEQIKGTFNDIVEYCCTHIEFTIGIIGIIVTVIFGIPAYIKFRRNKSSKNTTHVHKKIYGVSTSQSGTGNTQIIVTGGKSSALSTGEPTDADSTIKDMTVSVRNISANETQLIRMLIEKEEEIKRLKEQKSISAKDDDLIIKLKKQIANLKEQVKNDETKQTLFTKEREELLQRLEESAKKDIWKQPVADAVKENRFDDALKLIEEANKPNDEASAEAHYEQGSIYELKLDYKNSLYHFELAAKLQPLNSLYLNEGGLLSDTMGKYDEAIKYYTQALENETEDSPPKAALLNNIGAVWKSKGEYDKAIEYYEKALAIDKINYGEEHTKIAIRYNNIGEAWKSKGQYDKAIEYYEKALAIVKKKYGEEHPNIATYYNNIGGAWNRKGEYDKAIEYYEKALGINIKFHDEEHPNIAANYNNIGLAWNSKGQYDKAIEYYEKALGINIKFHGEEHPNIATDYNNIGLAWNSKGQYDKAIEYYDKSLTIEKKYHGEEHPSIAIRYNNIGGVWNSKGQYDKAIEYYEKALPICKKYLGENHPTTQIVAENLELARKARDEK